MNYTAAFSDFFRTPKWRTNLLLNGVCILIPMAGMIVLSGWQVTVLWGRKYHGTQDIPDFDFGKFIKYLERGICPFLVSLVVSIVIMPIAWGFMAIIAGAIMFTFNQAHPNDELAATIIVAGFIAFFCLFALLLVAISVLSLPFVIRATIVQDFRESFDLGFYKSFFSLTWKETLMATAFMFVVGAALMVIGMLACFVGMYFTMPLTLFASQHLHKQLYDLYVVRGGAALTPNPSLFDPPPLPRM